MKIEINKASLLKFYKNGFFTFYIGAFISLVMGLGSFLLAQSAIHEIEGLIALAISAILFSTIRITKAINSLSDKKEAKS